MDEIGSVDVQINLRAHKTIFGNIEVTLQSVEAGKGSDQLYRALSGDLKKRIDQRHWTDLTPDGCVRIGDDLRVLFTEPGHFRILYTNRQVDSMLESNLEYYSQADQICNNASQVIRYVIRDDPEFRGLLIQVNVKLSEKLQAEQKLYRIMMARIKREQHIHVSRNVAIVTLAAILFILAYAGSPIVTAGILVDVAQAILMMVCLMAVGYCLVCRIRIKQYDELAAQQLQAIADAVA